MIAGCYLKYAVLIRRLISPLEPIFWFRCGGRNCCFMFCFRLGVGAFLCRCSMCWALFNSRNVGSIDVCWRSDVEDSVRLFGEVNEGKSQWVRESFPGSNSEHKTLPSQESVVSMCMWSSAWRSSLRGMHGEEPDGKSGVWLGPRWLVDLWGKRGELDWARKELADDSPELSDEQGEEGLRFFKSRIVSKQSGSNIFSIGTLSVLMSSGKNLEEEVYK